MFKTPSGNRWGFIVCHYFMSVLTQESPLPLFVYGTLMRGFKNPLSELFHQNCEFIGQASVKGSLYRITYYPGAVPSQFPEEKVWGELYWIRNSNFWEALDQYEGLDESGPCEYVRDITSLQQSPRHGVCRAWIYWYNWATLKSQKIANGNFASGFKN